MSKVHCPWSVIVLAREIPRSCLRNGARWKEVLQNESIAGELGPLLYLLELLLCLPELGQVEGGNLLSILDLGLVDLDLLLELGGELGHPVLVLLVLALGELQLLHLPLRPLVGLEGLSITGLDVGELSLKIPDLGLKLCHGSLASLGSSSFSISKPGLKVSKLVVHGVLRGSKGGGVVLFGSQFISKAGSINHGLLGLLLSILSCSKHGINLSLKGVDATLKTPLCRHVASIDGLDLVYGSTGISNFVLNLSLGTISRVNECTALLDFPRKSSGLALRDANSLRDLGTGTGFVFKDLDGLPQLSLVALDRLESLSISLVSMVQSNFQFVDLSLELLLDPESFTLSPLLSFQRSSQRLHGTGMVLA